MTTFILMRSVAIQHNYPKQNSKIVMVSNIINLLSGTGPLNN